MLDSLAEERKRAVGGSGREVVVMAWCRALGALVSEMWVPGVCAVLGRGLCCCSCSARRDVHDVGPEVALRWAVGSTCAFASFFLHVFSFFLFFCRIGVSSKLKLMQTDKVLFCS
ncbi:hypothetical protein VPH35_012846 [Triticum aestivum]